MRNRLKIIVPALGVVLLLGALGIGAVFAADPPANATNPADHQKVLLGKVARILGIEEQRVTDAFVQANKEMRNEQIDRALAEGRITKELADWMKQRPDDGSIGPGGRGMMRGGRPGPMGGGPGGIAPAPKPAPPQ